VESFHRDDAELQAVVLTRPFENESGAGTTITAGLLDAQNRIVELLYHRDVWDHGNVFQLPFYERRLKRAEHKAQVAVGRYATENSTIFFRAE
jgi:hypothetical protein